MLTNNKYLSIQIGKDTIKVTYLSKGKHKATIYQAFHVPIAEGIVEEGMILEMDALVEVLREALKTQGIKAKDTLFSIYHPRIITRDVELPALSKAKLDQIIELNKQDYFPVDITGYLVGYRVVETMGEKDNKKVKVLLVAVPDEVLSQYIILCKALKLEMVGIDYQENSIYNFVQLQKYVGNYMLIHLENESTTVAIGEYEKVGFVKTVPFGTTNLIEGLQRQEHITYTEAKQLIYQNNILTERKENTIGHDYGIVINQLEYLLTSISAYIKYYQTRNEAGAIQQIYITGSGAQIPGISQYIQQALEINTSGLELLTGVVNKDKAKPNLIELGIESNIGSIFSDMKLMPREMTEHMKSREKTRLVVLLSILGIVGISSILIKPLQDIKRLEADKARLQIQIEDYEKVLTIKNVYDQLTVSHRAREVLLTMASSKSDGLLEVLQNLEVQIPTGVMIQSLSSTESGLTMNCIAQDRLTVARFIAVLKEIEGVNEVYVGSLGETAGPNPEQMVIQFAVTCSY